MPKNHLGLKGAALASKGYLSPKELCLGLKELSWSLRANIIVSESHSFKELSQFQRVSLVSKTPSAVLVSMTYPGLKEKS